MSLLEAEEVALARSSFSTSSTLRPRPAASRAMPAPLMPPPMTRRSYAAWSMASGGARLGPGGEEMLRELDESGAALAPRHIGRQMGHARRRAADVRHADRNREGAEHRLVVRRIADEQDAPGRALGVDAELGAEQPARHREL